MITADEKTKKILRKYLKKLGRLEDKFYIEVNKLERSMEKETKIEGIEFFMSDGAYVGVGNADRTMKLIPREELED